MSSESPEQQEQWFFFALRPPRQEANRMTAWLERTAEPGWEPMLAERLHVTLAITPTFATYPADIVARLLRAGEQVAAAPFRIDFDSLSVGVKSVALRPSRANSGAKLLQHALVRAMATQGVPLLPKYTFSPHVTLAYRTGTSTSQHPVDPFGWDVQEVVLIQSLIGRTRHIPLGTWPLTYRPPLQYALF
ncbi:MAG TPA: 2'-5' RNA ligase family protein [Sphingobium sp.]